MCFCQKRSSPLLAVKRSLRGHDRINGLVPMSFKLFDAAGHRLGRFHQGTVLHGRKSAVVEQRLELTAVGKFRDLLLLELRGGREFLTDAEHHIVVLSTFKLVLAFDLRHLSHGFCNRQRLGLCPTLSMLFGVCLEDRESWIRPLQTAHESISGALVRCTQPTTTETFL